MFDFRNEKVAMLVGLALLAQVSAGQSFNVDLDTPFPPQAGGGVPSDAFGGAANQPGRWNSLSTNGVLSSLFDLNGARRNVSMSTEDSTGGNLTGGAFHNASNTGDYAFLLNDAANFGAWRSWTFHGLMNGVYQVVTYAVSPFPEVVSAQVSVNNGPELGCFGPMPGNHFISGVTHVQQSATVTDGNLEILVFRGTSTGTVHVNGFQITAVPEPATLVFLSAGALAFCLRRIRK